MLTWLLSKCYNRAHKQTRITVDLTAPITSEVITYTVHQIHVWLDVGNTTNIWKDATVNLCIQAITLDQYFIASKQIFEGQVQETQWKKIYWIGMEVLNFTIVCTIRICWLCKFVIAQICCWIAFDWRTKQNLTLYDE